MEDNGFNTLEHWHLSSLLCFWDESSPWWEQWLYNLIHSSHSLPVCHFLSATFPAFQKMSAKIKLIPSFFGEFFILFYMTIDCEDKLSDRNIMCDINVLIVRRWHWKNQSAYATHQCCLMKSSWATTFSSVKQQTSKSVNVCVYKLSGKIKCSNARVNWEHYYDSNLR